MDWTPSEKGASFGPYSWFIYANNRFIGPHALMGRYHRHPDPAQERFFFGLLRECVETGVVSEDLLRDEMRKNHIRGDSLELLDRTPPLAA